MQKRVELLAPAGNYKSFLGAVRAGADAVYLAGSKFGARAYADNFTDEEVCLAVRYAHLHGKKVYLTVNILLKDGEIKELYDYLLPFYEEGLDGVIVQDLGAFQYIREHFPRLELHASTQMTITGVYGAKLLKELGACRIVPARELSLAEIARIKEEVEIEIEVFVHGAMCYCYSGACLFSSILGGRSGNRGRCAQPCRLPYEAEEEGRTLKAGGEYLLSLKDLCTLPMIPKLMEAGIDSFKIEGRMKKPEYAAGVTALYRKYIDLYYETPGHFKVSPEDMENIRKLYIRSELLDGYLERFNGKEMVTLSKPSYSSSDEALLEEIREKYLEGEGSKIGVDGLVILKAGEAVVCRLKTGEGKAQVTVKGGMVELASNRPLDEASVRKQMEKTGSTPFVFRELVIEAETSVFMPVKQINELRREAFAALEDMLLFDSRRNHMAVKPCWESEQSGRLPGEADSGKKVVRGGKEEHTPGFIASVSTGEQFAEAVRRHEIYRIYLSSDCLFRKEAGNGGGREEISSFLAEEYGRQAKAHGKELYLALPHIQRSGSYGYLEDMSSLYEMGYVDGFLLRNLETLSLLRELPGRDLGKIIGDAGIYCFNQEAKKLLLRYFDGLTASYEQNDKELYRMGMEHMDIPVYGRIPMMVTANCIQKTMGNCGKNSKGSGSMEKPFVLRDRYREEFPIVLNCHHCFNIIYNGKPSSLHQYLQKLLKYGAKNLRLDFTTESGAQIGEIITFFSETLRHPEGKIEAPYKEYTRGHMGRGVE